MMDDKHKLYTVQKSLKEGGGIKIRTAHWLCELCQKLMKENENYQKQHDSDQAELSKMASEIQQKKVALKKKIEEVLEL